MNQLFKFFFSVAAVSLLTLLGLLFYTQENVHEMRTFIQSADVESSGKFDANYSYDLEHREYAIQRSIQSTGLKQFIYLTETEQCLPPNLATSAQIGDPHACNCDVIVLSFRTKCTENTRRHVTYLFDPNTGWASGRNILFFAALDRRPGYHYYIFLNDDTVLSYNKFTPVDMKKLPPYRTVETWLLDYEPAVGVLDYTVHNGANVVLKRRRELCGINETSLVLPTVFFDAIFNAFHHNAIEHLLPYPTQYEYLSWFSIHIHTVTTVEVKFPGQALLFAPVTARNPKHRPYQRSHKNRTNIAREYIRGIKQEAPLQLRNHSLFELLNKRTKGFLTRYSSTFCLNITRHQPIIPYQHLSREIQASNSTQ